jgi:4-alpha-glucanotransferase
MSAARLGRLRGVLVPLSSIPSAASWGVGEFTDVPLLARWLVASGQRLLQLLPINEMPPGEASPYGALSAMALDPQFVSLRHLRDWMAIGGDAALDAGARGRLAAVRAAPRVEFEAVRRVKLDALRRAYARFAGEELAHDTKRARTFRAWCAREAWWLDDYALFRALKAAHGEASWQQWPAAIRDRAPGALASARAAHAAEVRFREYVQWVAGSQWHAVRQAVAPLRLFGDLPFMVSTDSADVWARQAEFRFDVSVGAPPDAFSAEGQDWGVPVYRWDVVAAGGFDWLRQRARRQARLYDGYRVDHLVGFYRTYARPRDGGVPFFTPGDEPAQTRLGEQVLGVLRAPGAGIVAEDLGTVPDFVRASLARLGVPGYKVFRWERRWREPGEPFVDPADYPEAAVATTGTHDTEPLAVWWAGASDAERRAVLAVPSIAGRLPGDARDAAAGGALTPTFHAALLETLFASPAAVVILPLGDLFGWTERINDPATSGGDNWRWRLPWPVDELESHPDARAVARRLAAWAAESGRYASSMTRGMTPPGRP